MVDRYITTKIVTSYFRNDTDIAILSFNRSIQGRVRQKVANRISSTSPNHDSHQIPSSHIFALTIVCLCDLGSRCLDEIKGEASYQRRWREGWHDKNIL